MSPDQATAAVLRVDLRGLLAARLPSAGNFTSDAFKTAASVAFAGVAAFTGLLTNLAPLLGTSQTPSSSAAAGAPSVAVRFAL